MTDIARQSLFLRTMTALALLLLADGIVEFALSRAIYQLVLCMVMFPLIGFTRWWWRRLLNRSEGKA